MGTIWAASWYRGKATPDADSPNRLESWTKTLTLPSTASCETCVARDMDWPKWDARDYNRVPRIIAKYDGFVEDEAYNGPGECMR